MFIGFAGYSSRRIYRDEERARTVASLLVDKRWPRPPDWAYCNLAENVVRRTRSRRVVGNKGRDHLIADISNATNYFLHVTRSSNDHDFPAEAHVTTGSKAIPAEAECPFEVNGLTRADELPEGADILRWIDLVHELMVVCDVASAMMPVWSTWARCRSDVAFGGFTLDTPRGDINLGTPEDFARQNRRANRWRYKLGGTYVRHPRWGTYLGASHMERIGGRAKIEDTVQPARIVELGKLTFIQLTEHPNTAMTPECERKRQALEALMEPIVAPGYPEEDTRHNVAIVREQAPSQHDVTTATATAGSAARARDWPACLAALLATWRAVRDARIAELVDRVAQVIAAAPIPEGSIQKALAKRVASASDADVTPILVAVERHWEAMPRLHEVVLELARARGADPRVARVLAKFVCNAPGSKAGWLYPDVVAALDAIDDPRFRHTFADAWDRVKKQMPSEHRERKAARQLLRMARAVAKRPPPAVLDGIAKLVHDVDAALAARAAGEGKHAVDRNALLRAIYNDPSDTSARLVYADALLHEGDLRGELIALQCKRVDRPASRRERELVKTHGRAWLGALDPIIDRRGFAYERGFLARARVVMRRFDSERLELLQLPDWATIEELELADIPKFLAREFLADPRWTALRAVSGIDADDAIAIARSGGEVPWTSLGLTGWKHELVDVGAFGSLVELDLVSSPHLRRAMNALPGTAFVRPLRRIRVGWEADAYGADATLDELVVAARRTLVPELDIAVTVGGDRRGGILRLAGDHATVIARKSRVDLRAMAPIVAAMPRGTIGAIAFAPGTTVVSRDSFDAAARTHGATVAYPA